MMQNLTRSNDGTILVYFSATQNGGTKVSIDNIIDYTPSKDFSCILISLSDLKKGESYNINLNGSLYTKFTLSNIISTIGSSNNMNNDPSSDMSGNGVPRGRR